MKEFKDFSVIIVNYKSEEHLDRCLTSLYALFGCEVSEEIIIVNNYPEEALEKIQQKFPAVKVISNQKNGGFGKGNNAGAHLAQGKYLFFLNPDTEIISGSLIKIFEKFETDNNLGAIGSCLITEKGELQKWSAGQEVTFWDLVKNNLGFLSSRRIWTSEKEIGAGWIAGTAFFIPREYFLNLGGFDERIFMYFEDVDLCKRIRETEKKITYFPEFKVLHKCGSAYSGEGSNWQKQNYYDSLVYYFEKHRPKSEAVIVKILRNLFFK